MLRRAIVNIVLNALDVLPNGGELHITTVMTHDRWELEIADNGPGWSEDALQRAAEPFFTTKNNGTGLGLSIVERIMEAHGGELWLHNCPEGGAAITLSFPAKPPAQRRCNSNQLLKARHNQYRIQSGRLHEFCSSDFG